MICFASFFCFFGACCSIISDMIPIIKARREFEGLATPLRITLAVFFLLKLLDLEIFGFQQTRTMVIALYSRTENQVNKQKRK
jgi:hypothetical protein